MYINRLKVLMLKRNFNSVQISKMADISKQAVSLWFKSGNFFIDLKISHLLRLCKALNVTLQYMVSPLPLIENKNSEQRSMTLFCWERLYPSFLEFIIAVIKKEHKAIARLVQIYGLYKASKICGSVIWKDFKEYKKYIHPIKRKECEFIWNFHQSRI